MCVCVRVYVCLYVYIHVYIYNIYTHKHKHTHTHTHIRHLNAFDGQSIRWLAKSSKWGINTTELYAWAKVPKVSELLRKFGNEIVEMVAALRSMGIGTVALAGMSKEEDTCDMRRIHVI